MNFFTPNRLFAVALFLLVVTAVCIRGVGVSRGLEQGYIYHPDTPKQIAAVQEYLDGEYYTVKGNLNYDGYPFFNSRLMELRIRLHGLFGGDVPSKIELFRMIRWQNVWLSALSVLFVALIVIGVSGSYSAALISAFLLSLSPVDVVTCHYAMGDTAAAFFATATVLGAVWIYRSGSFWSYAFSGIALACAFASKYHGAAAGIAVACAHILRYPNFRSFFGSKSLLRIIVASCVALITLPIAIPSMFSEPVKTVQNIVAFLEYTSNFKMSEELMQQSLPKRWLFGVTHNYPHFAYMLTGGLVAVILLGVIFMVRKNRAILIVASLPLIYIFVGLPFKPLSHIEYHTLVTPCLFALAAIVIMRVPDVVPQRYRNSSVMMITALITVTSGVLLSRTAYHHFYFSHSDTRSLATEWVYHNLPESFQVAAGHYSYMGIPPTVAADEKKGAVMLSSSFRPHRAPKNFASTFSFNLNDNQLELFRNPEITLYIHRSPWLHPNWVHPTFQTVPYDKSSGIVSADSPIFNRNPLRHVVSADNPLDLIISSANHIGGGMLVLQSADLSVKVKGGVGGQSVSVSLEPNSAKAILLPSLKRHSSVFLKANVYAWKMSVAEGYLMATLAIDPASQAVALAQAGLWDEASDAFDSEALANVKHPRLRAIKLMVNSQKTNENLENESESMVANIFEEYGINPELLKTAPAITVKKGDWVADENEPDTYRVNPIFMSPGFYSIENVGTHVSVYKSGTDDLLGTVSFYVSFGTAAVELRTKSPELVKISPMPKDTLQGYLN